MPARLGCAGSPLSLGSRSQPGWSRLRAGLAISREGSVSLGRSHPCPVLEKSQPVQMVQGQGGAARPCVGPGSASPSGCGCDPREGDLLLHFWVLLLCSLCCGLRVGWQLCLISVAAAASGFYQQHSRHRSLGSCSATLAAPSPGCTSGGGPGEGRGPLRPSCSKEEMPGQD